MKKTLIATAIAGAMSFSVAAQAAPTVYGNIQLAIDIENDNTAVNNGSTIGFKGEEALDNGLTGIYKAEFEFNAGAQKGQFSTDTDNDGKDDLVSGLSKGDNAYLGVKGGFGTVRVGSFDTVADDLISDAIFGEEFKGGEFSAFGGDNREWQQVQYSGEFGALEVRASVNMNGTEKADSRGDGDKDLSNAAQIGAKFAVAEGISVAAVFDSYDSAAGVAATADMDALSFGAAFETNDDIDYVASGSAAFNYGMGNVYAIVSMFDTGDIDGNRTTAGASYNLGQSMYVYAEVVSGDNDDLSDAKSTAIGAILSF